MASRRYGDDSMMHIIDADDSHTQLINMMNQHSTDIEHKHLLLQNHFFLKPIHNLPVMPFVEKVTFMDTVIKNGSILRFKQWCPNVSELAFIRAPFSRPVFESFASTTTDDDNIMPGVKKLIFHYTNSWDMFGYFPEEMDEKFPSLDELKLILDTLEYEIDFDPMMIDADASHQPMYFKSLRKFSLATFCNVGETDRIFENMGICNAKLEELLFVGVCMSKSNLQWISNCCRLRELTLDCDVFVGDEFKELKEMQSLTNFELIVEEIKCDAMQIIEFVRNNQQLNRVSIKCGPESKAIEIDDDFKVAFDQLICDRSELSINIVFNKPFEQQSIKITKEGIVETHVLRHEDDSDNDGDDSSSFDGSDIDIFDYVHESDDSDSNK